METRKGHRSPLPPRLLNSSATTNQERQPSTGDPLRKETFLIAKRTELLQALSALNVPWNAGPYSEPARRLLRDHATTLRQRLGQFDRLAAQVMADRSGWIVTHGEPHAGNIIRTRSGSMVVVDWAAVAYAPPERDLWMLLDEANPDWSTYKATTNVTSLSDRALTAYRLYWNLSDIAVFVSWCRCPHDRTEEMEMAWAELQAFVMRPSACAAQAEGYPETRDDAGKSVLRPQLWSSNPNYHLRRVPIGVVSRFGPVDGLTKNYVEPTACRKISPRSPRFAPTREYSSQPEIAVVPQSTRRWTLAGR